MQELKSVAEMLKSVYQIKAQLSRLGWLGTSENPTGFEVEATDSLPSGWVKLTSDGGSVYGNAELVLSALAAASGDDEFGECFATSDFVDRLPASSRDWPEDLIEFEQLEDGTANDNPITLVTVGTNAGLRYAVGPHGSSECALGNWIDSGEELAETRESVLPSA